MAEVASPQQLSGMFANRPVTLLYNQSNPHAQFGTMLGALPLLRIKLQSIFPDVLKLAR
jgi:hypothetical protein